MIRLQAFSDKKYPAPSFPWYHPLPTAPSSFFLGPVYGGIMGFIPDRRFCFQQRLLLGTVREEIASNEVKDRLIISEGQVSAQ